MLLYLLQGWDTDAQVVYDTLQDMYPEGKSGSIFARLAKEFWEEYQVIRDIGISCNQVVLLVKENQENVLRYIGIDGDPGMWLPFYTPQDICPFE